MRKKPSVIVIHPDTGERLCKDNKWRGHCNFGTYRSCVKVFKTEGWALRAARKVAPPSGNTTIVFLYENDHMDAAGTVWTETKDGNFYKSR